MPIPLPPADAIALLLGDLIGRSVTAKVTTHIAPNAQAIAVYLDESDKLQALAYCDLAVGASLGAALTLVPPDRVDECVKAKCLDDTLSENLYEVFNVLAAVFPKNGAPRVILRGLHCKGEAPAEVKTVQAKPGQRLDLDLTIAGYRSGKLTIVTP